MINSGLIKIIQDIMRQDDGVDGDAQRLSQLVWMIFLKVLDDNEKELELLNKEYVPAVPKEFQWRTWAENEEGLTGDSLLSFVNNKLFPTLKDLSVNANNARNQIVRGVFEDSHNYMKNGTLLRQVVNKINTIDFNTQSDRHAFNDIYETLLRSLQSAGNAGEYYTPRPVTQFVTEMVDPKFGESVLDPACGTGGFLSNAIEHIRKQVKTPEDERVLQDSIRGVEKKQLPHLLCTTNMILHGIEVPVHITRDNTLKRPLKDYGPSDRVDVVLTNPPFGGTEEPGIESNFPQAFRTRETADLFLVLIMKLLKTGGRAGIVLPDGSLFGEGVKTRIKEELLKECNLHTIIRLPKTVFAPYTPTATNLLFFTKGEPTKHIWYYEHTLPKGVKSYSKTKPIKREEFEPIKEWWVNRTENEHAWQVSIEEIKKRDYNLDIKNPNKVADAEADIQMLLEQHRSEKEIAKNIATELIQEFKSISSNKHTDDIKFVIDNLHEIMELKGADELLNKLIVDKATRGQLTDQNIDEGTGEELFELIQTKRDGISTKKKLQPIDIDDVPYDIPSNWEWVRLGDVCEFRYGKGLDKAHRHADGQYVVYGANGPLGRSDLSLVDGPAIVVGRKGSAGAVNMVEGPFWPSDVTYYIESEQFGAFNMRYLYYLLKKLDLPSLAGGIKPGLNRNDAYKLPVALPPIAEQTRIVELIDRWFELTSKLSGPLN